MTEPTPELKMAQQDSDVVAARPQWRSSMSKETTPEAGGQMQARARW